MKYLLALLAAAIGFFAQAQPVLTAATSTPVTGDIWYGHSCRLTGVAPGALGSGITWDYSSLIEIAHDTTTVVDCIATPYCDSFLGSSFAEVTMPDSTYNYFSTSADSYTALGGHSPFSTGVGYSHSTDPLDVLRYPVSYGSGWSDTESYWYHAPFAYSHVRRVSAAEAVGYGTLITPVATYTNCLMMRSIEYFTDSNYTSGSLHVSYSRGERFWWFKPGLHFSPLIIITENDLTSGAFRSVIKVHYNNGREITGIGEINYDQRHVSVFPVPASDIIHVENSEQADVELLDMTGRRVMLPSGVNSAKIIDIPVSSVLPGNYLLRIHSPSGVSIKHVVISH